MDPQQRLTQVVARLSEAGYSVTPSAAIFDMTALVGYTSQFHWKWMVRIHRLVYVQMVDTVTVDGLARFSAACMEHALAAKGAFRGLQVGVAVIPIQIGARVEPGGHQYAQQQILRQMGAFAWPVALDATTGEASRHTGHPLIGMFFTSWMRKQVDAVTAIA